MSLGLRSVGYNIVNFFLKNCPDKISDQFSIWSEKLNFGWKIADRRPLFQALIPHRYFVFFYWGMATAIKMSFKNGKS